MLSKLQILPVIIRYYFVEIILLILLLVTYRAWLFNFGYLVSGDWVFHTRIFLEEFLRLPQLWESFNSFGNLDVLPVFDLFKFLYGLLSKVFILNYSLSERILYFWPIVIFSYIGVLKLGRFIFKENKLGYLFFSLLFLFNTYILSTQTSFITYAVVYALSPLIFFYFIELLEASSVSIKGILKCCLLLFLSSCYEPRGLVAIAYFLTIYLCIKLLYNKQRLIKVLNFSITFILLLILNLYWILPQPFSHSLTNISSTNSTFTAYNSLLDSLSLHNYAWQGNVFQYFQIKPFHNIPTSSYFFIVTLITFSIFIFKDHIKREEKVFQVIFLPITSLLAVFLIKQQNYPFGYVYEWLFHHFPTFSLFRESNKFFVFLLSFSLLFGFSSSYLLNLIKINFIRNTFAFTLACLILLNIKPILTNEIRTLFVQRYVPSDYNLLNQDISIQNKYFRTLWIPRYSGWGLGSSNNPALSGNEIIQQIGFYINDSASPNNIEDKILSIFEKSYSKDMLDISSIKYIVVPVQDLANDDNFFIDYGGDRNADIRNYYINTLDHISYLKRIIIGTKDLIIYENKDYKPPIFLFTTLLNFDSGLHLNSKYNFAHNTLNNDFLFSENSTSTSLPFVSVSNILENPTIENISSTSLKTTIEIATSSVNSLYKNNNNSEIIASVRNNELVIIDDHGDAVDIGNDTISNKNESSSLYSTTLATNDYISYKNIFTKIGQESIDLGLASSTQNINIYKGTNNEIPNPSFESGLWQDAVGDCNNFDSNGKISMSLTTSYKSEGSQSLELQAANHIACTSTTFPVNKGAYLFSFDYQSPNAKTAGYYISFDDPLHTTLSEIIPIQNGQWNSYLKRVVVPEGATHASLLVYSYATDGTTYMLNRYDNFIFSPLKSIATIAVPTQTGFTESPLTLPESTTTITYINPYLTNVSMLKNGSFESGLWQTNVGDCNNFDKNPKIEMTLDRNMKTDGNQSLELSATRHTACTSESSQVQGGGTYLLSFDYQSPNAQSASYYIGFNGTATSSSYSVDVPITNKEWHSYSNTIQVPEDASQISLSLYAKSTDGSTNIVNRYDNVKLIKIPNLVDAYYLVSKPSILLNSPTSITFDQINPTKKLVDIKGAATGFFLAMGESWHPLWQLEMNNGKIHGFLSSWTPLSHPDKVPDDQHFELDGFLNGWYVDVHQLCEVEHVQGCAQNADGSYNLEMEIEFWPQRWFYVGLVVSGTTLAAVLSYLGYSGIMALRKRQQRRMTEQTLV